MKKWISRTRGFEIEAIRLNEENAATVAAWSGSLLVEEIDPFYPEETQPGLNVNTPTGVVRASLGDYVARVGRSMYVVKASVFEKLYGEKPAEIMTPNEARSRLGFADPFDDIR